MRPARATTTATWGLDSGGDGLNWRHRGACTDGWDPNLWTSPVAEERGQARWVCLNECTVRTACLRWANENRPLVRDAVYGGVLWTRKRNGTEVRLCGIQPAPRRPTGQPAHGDEQRPLAVTEPDADRIAQLWADGESLPSIAEQVGCSQNAIAEVIAERGLTRPRRQPCGTYAAYKRHRRLREPPCDPCRQANRRRQVEYRERAIAQAEAGA